MYNLWISRPCGADLLAIARPHPSAQTTKFQFDTVFFGACTTKFQFDTVFFGACTKKFQLDTLYFGEKNYLNANDYHLQKT